QNVGPRLIIPSQPMFSEPPVMFSAHTQSSAAARSQLAIPETPVVSGCGPNGTVFNLEPALNARLQDEESVDFLYDGVAPGADLIVAGADDFGDTFDGVSAYYGNRLGAGCLPTFEGVLPNLVGLHGEAVSAEGGPMVAADPARSAFFIADQHLGANNTSGTTG